MKHQLSGTSNRKKSEMKRNHLEQNSETGSNKQVTLKKHTLESIGSWNHGAQEAWENVTIGSKNYYSKL